MDDFRNGLVDSVVVNRGQLKADRKNPFHVVEQVAQRRVDIRQTLILLVVCHEQVRVDLVDENFIENVLLDLTRLHYQIFQSQTSAFIVLLVSVNDINECATLLDNLLHLLGHRAISREIDNSELNVVIVFDILLLDASCRQ